MPMAKANKKEEKNNTFTMNRFMTSYFLKLEINELFLLPGQQERRNENHVIKQPTYSPVLKPTTGTDLQPVLLTPLQPLDT